MKKLTILFIWIGFAAITLFPGGQKEPKPTDYTVRSVDRSVPSPAGGGVVIDVVSGQITLRGAQTDKTTIKGTIGKHVIDLAVETKDLQTVIKSVIPDINNMADVDLSSNLDITVPEGSSVSIKGLAASFEIAGIKGPVQCDTLSGTITCRETEGFLSLGTLSGKIDVADAGGGIRYGAGMGDVILAGIRGHINGSSMNGKVSITDSVIDWLDITSFSGNIYFSGEIADGGDARIVSTFGGHIEMVLPESVEGRFTLQTSGGPDAVDLTEFKPSGELTWVFEPGEAISDGTERLRNVISPFITVSNSAVKRLGENTMTIESAGDITSAFGELRMSVSGLLTSGLNTMQEFTVGSDNVRVFLECSRYLARSGSEESETSGIVLKTR